MHPPTPGARGRRLGNTVVALACPKARQDLCAVVRGSAPAAAAVCFKNATGVCFHSAPQAASRTLAVWGGRWGTHPPRRVVLVARHSHPPTRRPAGGVRTTQRHTPRKTSVKRRLGAMTRCARACCSLRVRQPSLSSIKQYRRLKQYRNAVQRHH